MNFYRDLWPINTENVDDLDMPLVSFPPNQISAS